MKTLAILLIAAAALGGAAHAGEVVHRPLGKDAAGNPVHGYVYQAESRNRPRVYRSYSGYSPYSYYRPYPHCSVSPQGTRIVIQTGVPVISNGHGRIVPVVPPCGPGIVIRKP